MGKRKELTKEEKEKIEIAKQELKDYRENIKYIEEKIRKNYYYIIYNKNKYK